jgi:hypothetical protein
MLTGGFDEEAFSEEQMVSILRQAEAGTAAKDVCRKYGIAGQAFYLLCGLLVISPSRPRISPVRCCLSFDNHGSSLQ